MTETARAGLDVLAEAAQATLRRVRRRSTLWWRNPVADGRTRAAAVGDLVAELVRLEQAVGRDQAPPGVVRPPVPPREDVLADQLAVVTYDLLRALSEPRPGADTAGPTAEAVAHCVLTAYALDPGPVPGAHLDAALAGARGPLRGRLEALPRLGDA